MTKKKKTLIGLALVPAFILTLSVMRMTNDKKEALFPGSPLLRELAAPFQVAVTTVIQGTNNFFAYFTDNKELRLQNEAMEKEIAQLNEKVQSLQEQGAENLRLREMLQYKQQRQDNYEMVTAGVIGRDPGNWFQTLMLDKGSKDGIGPRMTVVNHQGLVGSVISVTPNTSEVLLILDREAAVGARIFETRDTPGIVVGNGGSNLLQMVRLPNDVNIAVGQTIVTSGLGGLYPKGIRIGEVSDVQPDPYSSGLTKTATIKPFVDFSRLEEVFIIKQVKNPEADIKMDITGAGEEPAV